MFGKALAVFFFVTLLATAMPGKSPPPVTKTVTVTAPGPTVTTISQCNTGDAQCCDTIGAANSLPGVATILDLLHIVAEDLSVVVGLGCTPITVLGLGQSADCAQKPVCCTNNDFHGIINIGCVPISL